MNTIPPNEQRNTRMSPLGYPSNLLAPNETYERVNETISSIVLKQRQPAPWWIGFIVGLWTTDVVLPRRVVAAAARRRYLGRQHSGRVGIRDRELRLVDRHRPRRHVHLRNFAFAVPALAHRHQSFRRSDDALRCRVRRIVSAAASRSALGFLLVAAVSRHDGTVAAVSQPARLGCFCGRHLFHCLAFVLVSRAAAGPRHPARSRDESVAEKFYGVLALGWRNSAAHWQRHQMAYLLLAGLATPLVLSVHSVVSLDFAVAQLPGWHSTIFPPYFVAGAIYSGFAMVLNIVIPVRKVYHLEHLITERHLNNMANVMLATGMMVAYGYFIEAFMSWYSGDIFEEYMMINRAFGPYGWIFWVLMLCNVIIPQALWSARIRRNPLTLFIVAFFINIGMWVERFVIVITSLHRDFVPSSWGMFFPTIWDWATLFGSVGLFLTLLFLFVRFLPMISISEERELVAEPAKANAL